METKANPTRSAPKRRELPVIQDSLQRQGKTLVQVRSCGFDGYDADLLMNETKKLRELITKRGTLEILIPLCCTTDPVRYIKFRNSLKGFSSKTLASRLKQLERNEILERRAYKEIPPRVEYRLTNKGQELAESVVDLLQWMRKWSRSSSKNRSHDS
jgi:DNA-binding HxlR family transcriptional regulator